MIFMVNTIVAFLCKKTHSKVLQLQKLCVTLQCLIQHNNSWAK